MTANSSGGRRYHTSCSIGQVNSATGFQRYGSIIFGDRKWSQSLREPPQSLRKPPQSLLEPAEAINMNIFTYDSFDTFVFDCDGAYMASSNTVSRAHACEGVLWRGNVLIDGIKELFQMLNRDV